MTMKKRTLQSLMGIAFFGFVAVVILASSAYRIDETEQAVIVQFGEPMGDVINKPGLHWKKPFVQEVRRFDKRIQRWDGDVNQIPTLGREFIVVDTMARWRISDPLLFLKSVRDEAGVQTRLNDILDSVVRDTISNSELEEIVRSRDWKIDPKDLADLSIRREDVDLEYRPKKGREELTREILADARKVVPEYGITLIDLRIKRLNYIPDVSRKVEERMISERQRVAEQFRSEGEGRSAEIDGETQKKVRVIMSDAQRQAEEIKGKADAEATRIYGESYGRDPEFYAFFQSLETYRDTIGPNTTLMIRADSDFFSYIQSLNPEGAKALPSPGEN